jgi:hypothetical protein
MGSDKKKKASNAAHDYSKLDQQVRDGMDFALFKITYPSAHSNTFYTAQKRVNKINSNLAGSTVVSVASESLIRLFNSLSYNGKDDRIIQAHGWLAETASIIEKTESYRLENEGKRLENEIAQISLHIANSIKEDIEQLGDMPIEKRLEKKIAAYRALKPIGKS